MSWVFLTDDQVYKLKKPVRFPYLDFSTIEKRRAACNAELMINRRLAPGVYLAVLPLVRTRGGLKIDGDGEIVDWLVVMRRLADRRMLDNALLAREVTRGDLDRLGLSLSRFYRHARPLLTAPDAHLADWRRRITANRRALADPRFGLPQTQAARIDRAERRFLSEHGDLIEARVAARRLVDGHGDLRPEHIFVGEPVMIIDRLEFNPAFRAVDPFDELAFLSIECDVLGRPEVGRHVSRRVAQDLGEEVDPLLFSFYRCHRAAMRARLAAAHLVEPDGRMPERWRPLALRYLAVAAAEALTLERALAEPSRLRRRIEAPQFGPVLSRYDRTSQAE